HPQRLPLREHDGIGPPSPLQSERSVRRLQEAREIDDVMLMKETIIVEKVAVKKLKNAILITGLPGIGLIGQVVGRYLVEELGAEKIANVISPHFPHQVFMTKKGGMRIIKNSFYHHKAKKRDVLILLGDVQAMSSVGQYEVAGVVLEYCKK